MASTSWSQSRRGASRPPSPRGSFFLFAIYYTIRTRRRGLRSGQRQRGGGRTGLDAACGQGRSEHSQRLNRIVRGEPAPRAGLSWRRLRLNEPVAPTPAPEPGVRIRTRASHAAPGGSRGLAQGRGVDRHGKPSWLARPLPRPFSRRRGPSPPNTEPPLLYGARRSPVASQQAQPRPRPGYQGEEEQWSAVAFDAGRPRPRAPSRRPPRTTNPRSAAPSSSPSLRRGPGRCTSPSRTPGAIPGTRNCSGRTGTCRPSSGLGGKAKRRRRVGSSRRQRRRRSEKC